MSSTPVFPGRPGRSIRLKPRPSPGLLSLVIPIYNEEEVLPLLRERIARLADTFGCDIEILLVDDGSSDNTLEGLLDWADADSRVGVLALSRNFGHQAASTAGLDHARGDAVILMDADLQDPPELIQQMIDQYKLGYDVVYARRTTRDGETLFKRVSAWLFYRIMRAMVHKALPADTGDYRLVSSECLHALRSMRETHRFLRGMVAWLGFQQTSVEFVRPARAAGQTKYPLSKMLRFAWTAIVSFSPTPLRVAFSFSFLVAAVGLGVAVFTLYAWFNDVAIMRGWTSIMLTLSLIGSCILVSLGVIGEYLARLYEEAKDRPLYMIQERLSVPSRSVRSDEPVHAKAAAGVN